MRLATKPQAKIEIRLPHPAGWEAAPVAQEFAFWDGGEESNRRQANGLARELAELKQAPEARWNYVGQTQGHYVKGIES